MQQDFEHLENDQDVDEILRLAVGKTTYAGDLRARMEASAAELGVSPEALAEAEAEYFRRKVVESEEKAAKLKRRRSFVEHFASYLGVNLLLIGIWYFNNRSGSFWPIWPIMGWGLCGLFPHFVNAIILNKDNDDGDS